VRGGKGEEREKISKLGIREGDEEGGRKMGRGETKRMDALPSPNFILVGDLLTTVHLLSRHPGEETL
jgi:hypothetical protein